MLPLISVIIPVLNEEKFIEKTLRQISEQNYPKDRYEVILIDGQSNDNTVQISKSLKNLFCKFKILENHKHLSSAGRNIGFKEAEGEYLIIIDGHVYIENKDLFRDMVEIFEETDLEVLSRPQPLTPPDISYFQAAAAFARESTIGHGFDSTIYNIEFTGVVNPCSSGAMYRSSILNKIGFYDETFDAAEDYEYNYRIHKAHLNSYLSPKLTVYYYPRDSIFSLFRQMKRYGMGRNRMLKKHGEGLFSGAIIPPAFFLSLMLLTILSLVMKSLRPLPLLLVAIYLFTLCAGSVFVAMRKGWKYFPLLPIIYLTIHLGLGFGMIYGFFVKSRET